jgi:uncharacterized protein YodC (DUF2158 family)
MPKVKPPKQFKAGPETEWRESMIKNYTHWGFINCATMAEGDSITFKADRVDCVSCKRSRAMNLDPSPEQIKEKVQHWCEDFDPTGLKNKSYCGKAAQGDVLTESEPLVNCPDCIEKHNNREKRKDFKPGDVVRLKSGGPLMTVDLLLERTNRIKCRWFKDGGGCGSFDFNPVALVPVSRSEQ